MSLEGFGRKFVAGIAAMTALSGSPAEAQNKDSKSVIHITHDVNDPELKAYSDSDKLYRLGQQDKIATEEMVSILNTKVADSDFYKKTNPHLSGGKKNDWGTHQDIEVKGEGTEKYRKAWEKHEEKVHVLLAESDVFDHITRRNSPVSHQYPLADVSENEKNYDERKYVLAGDSSYLEYQKPVRKVVYEAPEIPATYPVYGPNGGFIGVLPEWGPFIPTQDTSHLNVGTHSEDMKIVQSYLSGNGKTSGHEWVEKTKRNEFGLHDADGKIHEAKTLESDKIEETRKEILEIQEGTNK